MENTNGALLHNKNGSVLITSDNLDDDFDLHDFDEEFDEDFEQSNDDDLEREHESGPNF